MLVGSHEFSSSGEANSTTGTSGYDAANLAIPVFPGKRNGGSVFFERVPSGNIPNALFACSTTAALDKASAPPVSLFVSICPVALMKVLRAIAKMSILCQIVCSPSRRKDTQPMGQRVRGISSKNQLDRLWNISYASDFISKSFKNGANVHRMNP